MKGNKHTDRQDYQNRKEKKPKHQNQPILLEVLLILKIS